MIPTIDTLPFEIHLLILEYLPDLYSLQSAIESRAIGELSPRQLRQLKSSIFQSEISDFCHGETYSGRQCGKLFRELLIADREELELAWPVFKDLKMEELLIPAAVLLARRYSESNHTDCAINLLERIWEQVPPFGWSTIPSGRPGGSALRFFRLRAERQRLRRLPTLFPIGKCLLELLAEEKDQQYYKFIEEELELISADPAFASLPVAFIAGKGTVSIHRPREYEYPEPLFVDGMFRYELPSPNHSEGYRWYNDPIVVGISNRSFLKPSDDLQAILEEHGILKCAVTTS